MRSPTAADTERDARTPWHRVLRVADSGTSEWPGWVSGKRTPTRAGTGLEAGAGNWEEPWHRALSSLFVSPPPRYERTRTGCRGPGGVCVSRIGTGNRRLSGQRTTRRGRLTRTARSGVSLRPKRVRRRGGGRNTAGRRTVRRCAPARGTASPWCPERRRSCRPGCRRGVGDHPIPLKFRPVHQGDASGNTTSQGLRARLAPPRTRSGGDLAGRKSGRDDDPRHGGSAPSDRPRTPGRNAGHGSGRHEGRVVARAREMRARKELVRESVREGGSRMSGRPISAVFRRNRRFTIRLFTSSPSRALISSPLDHSLDASCEGAVRRRGGSASSLRGGAGEGLPEAVRAWCERAGGGRRKWGRAAYRRASLGASRLVRRLTGNGRASDTGGRSRWGRRASGHRV